MIADAYFSVIFLHSIFSLFYSWKFDWAYFMYVGIIGGICSFIVKYAAMILEQKKLI